MVNVCVLSPIIDNVEVVDYDQIYSASYCNITGHHISICLIICLGFVCFDRAIQLPCHDIEKSCKCLDNEFTEMIHNDATLHTTTHQGRGSIFHDCNKYVAPYTQRDYIRIMS